MKLRVAVVGTVAALMLAACSSSQSSTPSGTPTPIPTGASNATRQLAMFEPNDGPAPVVEFIAQAKTSLDIGMFEFDPTFTEVVDALKEAKKRGVVIRILLSRQRLDAVSTKQNHEDVEIFKKMGFNAALSWDGFAWYHEKALVSDAGTPRQRALIADFNLATDYFSTAISPYDANEAGTRGMGVIDTDKADVDNIVQTFNEDWPPYKTWTGSTRPELVWGPSGPKYPVKGNSIEAFTKMINSAQKTLDCYVQVFNDPALMLQPILDAAKRGVKVRILTNAKGIAYSIYPQLQAAGIEVLMQPASIADPSKYMYVHTKTIIADYQQPTAVAFVGSENPFLNDSLLTERELGVLLTDPLSLDKAHVVFDRDFSTAKPYVNVSPSPSSS